MYHMDTAVNMNKVTKTFLQWQRENTTKSIIKNLLKPEKKTIIALDDVSFKIKKGEFVAYAGPNGAGKSTTMKLLCGMLLPKEGEISVLGMSPKENRIKLMDKVGVLFGNRTELWWDHPIIQSFEWKKVVWNIPDDIYNKNLNLVIELLDIKDIMKTFARELSLGQRMKADVGLMLLHDPELILLDEPTLGLDVVAKRQMIDFLKRINKENKVTIIVTSHDMDDLEEMAQRILMISKGKIVFDGDFNGLRSLTGNLSRVRIETNNIESLSIDGCKLISKKGYISEWEVDLTKVPIKELFYKISLLNHVKDVEIKKAPIEQVISELYKTWK